MSRRAPSRSTARTFTRPLASYVLRVHEERIERLVLRYELLDLATGTTLRFTTLKALQRHLEAVPKVPTEDG